MVTKSSKTPIFSQNLGHEEDKMLPNLGFYLFNFWLKLGVFEQFQEVGCIDKNWLKLGLFSEFCASNGNKIVENIQF